MDSVDVKNTVMAIREELMKYFKGTCIESFILKTNVRTTGDVERHRYQYERRQAQNENPRTLWIGDVPVLTAKYLPDRITFHTSVLQRSPQLRQVHRELEKFMDRYLMGVARDNLGEYIGTPKDDTDLISKTKLGKRARERTIDDVIMEHYSGLTFTSSSGTMLSENDLPF